MKEIVFLIKEDKQGGYSAKAIGVSIHTQADSLIELEQNIREAVACHFDA